MTLDTWSPLGFAVERVLKTCAAARQTGEGRRAAAPSASPGEANDAGSNGEGQPGCGPGPPSP